ncbi:MAG: VOC family protein [Streptosporangiaceae bacterium]
MSNRARRPAAAVIQAVDHVAIAVRDADKAARTFTRLLGWPVVHDEIVAAAAVRLVYLGPAAGAAGTGAAQLQLVQPVAAGALADLVAAQGEGLHHVCFRTADINGALLAAGQRGTDGVFTGGRGQPCAFLAQEPHGARIELTEMAGPVTAAFERGQS